MKKYLKLLLFVLALGTIGLLVYQKQKQTCKVQLIGIGFPKCGTTYLFKTLSKNPNLNFLLRPYDLKGEVTASELNYFGNLSKKSYVRIGLYSKGEKKIFRPPINFYQSLLDEQKVNLEKSPQYIWNKQTLQEIYRYNPNVKIVVQLRNPVDWLYSYYKHALRFYDEPEFDSTISFEDFLKVPCPNDKSKSVLEAANFDEYVKQVYEVFPKENVIILAHEKLYKFNTMSELCKFLSLPCSEESKDLLLKFSKPFCYREQISEKLYDSLTEYYKPSTERLHGICQGKPNCLI